MKRMEMLSVLIMLGMLIPVPVLATEAAVVNVTAAVVVDQAQEENYLETEIPVLARQAPGDVISALLTFRISLPAKTEVELWPITRPDTEPWKDNDAADTRLVWVTDENTGSLVRFDVTDFVREASVTAQSIPVAIKLAPDQSVRPFESQTTVTLSLELHQSPSRSNSDAK